MLTRLLTHAAVVGAALLCVVPATRAQSLDSARVGPSARPSAAVADPAAPLDSLVRPPISPKAALLRSLAIPGWGQASLHRSTAGGIFAALEMTSIAMLIQSKHELRNAQQAARDSVIDPTTGGFVANPLAGRIGPRKQAVEDWAALLIATHLFAAADAFVAAHLWDVPVEVGGRGGARHASISARIRF
ncbi:MAG TPA: hypothetical protein VFS44_13960 [Gemmatimonadaceae bacterium]|nr:hypothetical protein [Gemmatimonadaceae bacterium]